MSRIAHSPSVLSQNVTGRERALKKPEFWSLQFFHNVVRKSVRKDRSRNSEQIKQRQAEMHHFRVQAF